MKYNRILFIGFRCVGKTTLSKLISKKILYKLLDTDDEIEREQKKTINEITENGKNWVSFRELELKKIKELLQIKNIIISAGGGIGVNNIIYNEKYTYGDVERTEIINSKDTLKILLEASEDTIRKRLYDRKIKLNNSPDLKEKSDNIEEYIENNIKVMKERKKNYNEMANIIFDTTSSNFNKLSFELFDIIKDKIL